GVIHTCAALPTDAWLWACALGAPLVGGGAALLRRRGSPGAPRCGWLGQIAPVVCFLAAGMLAGMASAGLRASARLADALADVHHDQVSRLAVQVIELVQDQDGARRFLARAVGERPAGVPARLRVTWRGDPAAHGGGLPEVAPGQVWRMALVLRRPYGASNPH